MTMTRRRMLDDTFKKSVVGNPAIATDSLARMYPGITMQGWTEQEETTGAQLFDERAKVPETNLTPFPVFVGEGTFTLSTNAGRSSTGNSFIFFASGNVSSGGDGVYKGKSVSVQSNDGYVTVLGRIMDNINPFDTYNTMLNAGSTALPYEPYTGGAPSPSPDYPQEIVNAGKYNEDTQKWKYEITIANAQTDPDKNQTVTLTADRPLTKWDKLEKRNGQWGWVYKSEEIESYTDESVPGEYYSTTGQLSAGAQVWYETTTETFVPLTTTEQEAMEALHTYRPTTVLSNDAGCEMSLTYKTRKSMEVTA